MIVLVTLGVYLPAMRGGFIWDDVVSVTKNPLIQIKDGLYYIWFTTKPYDYFPLTYTATWVEWQLWGARPAGYHIVNVVLHAFNAVLVWRLLARVRVSAAWLAALVFAVHPVCVASVAWITELKNTLSLVFFLLSILWYLCSEESRVQSPVSKTGARNYYGLSLFAFLLALLSKTSAVTLPIILLLCLWWQRRPATHLLTHSPAHSLTLRAAARTLPFFALSLLLGLVTIWFQTQRAMGGQDYKLGALPARLLAGSWGLWFYVGKILAPTGLAAVYPRWEIKPAALATWVPGALWAATLAASWRYRRGWGGPVFFALAYFTVALGPVLGPFKMSFHAYSWVADHFQYPAMIGIIALVVGGCAAGVRMLGTALWPGAQADDEKHYAPRSPSPLPSPPGRERIAALRLVLRFAAFLCAALLVAGLSLLTWRHAWVYAEEKRLWADNLEKNPGCWVAHINYGKDLAAAGKVDEAISHYYAAARLKPDYALTYRNLGGAFGQKGQFEKAAELCARAVELDPQDFDAQNNLGAALSRIGKYEEARIHFAAALKILPAFADAYYNLGLTEMGRRNFAEAAAAFSAALKSEPNSPELHHNLGLALEGLKREPDAAEQYQAVLQLDPVHAGANYQYANILLKQGRTNEAYRCYHQSVRSNPNFPQAQYQLGAVAAALARPAEAIAHWREAVRLKPNWVEALNNLAWLLATQPDDRLRNGAEAVQWSSKAVELTGRKDFGALDTLAAAYAEAGRFAEAETEGTNALQLAIIAHDKMEEAQLRARVALYRAHSAYREP